MNREKLLKLRLRTSKNIAQAWAENSRVKCDCGHHLQDHEDLEGQCNECDCIEYWPNYRYIQRKQKELEK